MSIRIRDSQISGRQRHKLKMTYYVLEYNLKYIFENKSVQIGEKY